MATTFRLELNHKRNKDGSYSIFVRLCQDRRIRRFKSSVSVDKKNDWNPSPRGDNWIRPSDPAAATKNQKLRDELDGAKAQYDVEKKRGKGKVSINKLAEAKKKEDVSPRFLPYAEKITEDIKATGHIRNAKKYKNFCNKLRAFDKNVVFADIDSAYLKRFETYLSKLPNERIPEQRLSVNAIHAEMKTFRAILNRARNIDRLIQVNPFESYKLKLEKTSKDKLSRDELKAILELDLPEGSMLWHTRNAFMLSFYCAGIRAGDLLQLRWCNVSAEGRITYQMDKNGKERDLVMVKQAQEILMHYRQVEHQPTDYIFPLLPNDAPWAKYVTHEQKQVMPVKILEQLLNKISSVNTILNKNLKKLAEMAKIEKHVTFHVSRHSFATMALKESVDTMTIKSALAHSSLKTTETYLQDFDMTEIDSTLQRVFDQKPDVDKLIKQILMLDESEREKLFSAVIPQHPASTPTATAGA